VTVRIHFTDEDLGRTRLAEGPRPFVELHVALRVLQETGQPIRFGAWRRDVLTRLQPRARQLLDLIPARGYSTDFFIPVHTAGAEESLEAVRATTRTYLRQDVALWTQLQPRVASWTRRIPAEPDLFQHLADTLGHAHDEMIAPYWPRIARLAQADRALRLRQVADHGMHGLLARLNPRRLRWTPPVLEAATVDGREADVHLGGRGLLLIPSFFRSSYPVVNAGARPQPWMTFPLLTEEGDAVLPATAAAAVSRSARSLHALLGRSRATVLSVIADHPGCTTTELAHRAAMSKSGASEHATVLRAAGLTRVTRHRHGARHALTPLGEALMNSTGPSGGS